MPDSYLLIIVALIIAKVFMDFLCLRQIKLNGEYYMDSFEKFKKHQEEWRTKYEIKITAEIIKGFADMKIEQLKKETKNDSNQKTETSK
jgi:hypothetical protein